MKGWRLGLRGIWNCDDFVRLCLFGLRRQHQYLRAIRLMGEINHESSPNCGKPFSSRGGVDGPVIRPKCMEVGVSQSKVISTKTIF